MTTTVLKSAKGRRMAVVEIISWSISMKVWDQARIELTTPGSAVRHVMLLSHHGNIKIWNLRHNQRKWCNWSRKFDTLWILAKCLTILANMFYKWYKCLRMLANCVANETRTQKHGYIICIIHIVGVPLCLISARPCRISLFSLKFILIIHIRSAFYRNVNTNTSKSLQTSYDHYKCLAINKNGLRLLTNMLWICFSSTFMTMFLIFARPQECLWTPQECLQNLWISCDHCELTPDCIRKPIRNGVRAALLTALCGPEKGSCDKQCKPK